LQVQHFKRKFTTGDNPRPVTEHPSLVELLRKGSVDRAVGARVVNRDHLIVHFHGMWNPNRVVKNGRDAFGQAGLTGPGRTVQEKRGARDDSRPDSRHDVFIDDDFLKGLDQIFWIDFCLLDALRANPDAVAL